MTASPRSEPTAPATASLERNAAYLQLRAEVEDFLYLEADLLDERRYREWLDLLAEDISYFMPMRRNVKFGQHAERENTKPGEGISWFDEDKWTLTKRVDQILTGVHYAEEPLSRICHLVTNIRIVTALPSVADAQDVEVSARFVVYQKPDRIRELHFHRPPQGPPPAPWFRLADRSAGDHS